MSPDPDKTITVCVPVYNAAGFIDETLDALNNQSFPDLKILVSVDSSTDTSASICRRYCTNSGFEVFEQNSRLGWVENCNFLLNRVNSAYFCIIPHDDLIHPDYFQILFNTMLEHPDASCVYSDIACFGEHHNKVRQHSVTGIKFDRILEYITSHFPAVCFRGLVRKSFFKKLPLLKSNSFDGFAADTLWGLELACAGDLVRVRKYLYSKRSLPDSTHMQWKQWDREKSIAAWVTHCCQCAEILCAAGLPETEMETGLYACLQRLLQTTGRLWPFVPHDTFTLNQGSAVIQSWIDLLSQSGINYSSSPVDLINRHAARAIRGKIYTRQGKLQLDEGNVEQAAVSIQKAADLNPGMPDTFSLQGRILVSQGNIEAALVACEKAIKLAPDNAGYYHQCSNVLFRLGQIDKAIANQTITVSLSPETARYHHFLSKLFKHKGMLEEAVMAAETACRLEQDNPNYRINYNNLVSMK